MNYCLTLISPDEFKGLPSAQVDAALRKFDAVSVKCLNGTSKYEIGKLKAFQKRLDKLGVPMFGWGWANARTVDEAVLEARCAAQICNALGLEVWFVNCEKTWAGVEGAAPTKDPYGALDAYVSTFYEECRTCHLVYNGFSWDRNSKKYGSQKLHDETLIRRFYGWSPMLYGTNQALVQRNWNTRLFRYPGMRLFAMPGCGRIDKEGNVWGTWQSDPRTGVYGTKDLLLNTRPDWVCWFFGNGAKDQLLTGHKKHPPLTTCIDELNREVPR